MRKLVTSRLFRCVVCLILVCCMIVNVVSIRARASALPEVVGVVTKIIPFNPGAGAAAGGAAAVGSQIFGYVLGGLGLVVSVAQTIDLMNQYSEFTGELETSIYYYPDGTWSYGVDMGFIERVRAFLWGQGFLVNSNDLNFDSVDPPPAWALAEAKSARYAQLVYITNAAGTFTQWNLFYSNESPILVSPNNTSTGEGVWVRLEDSSATGYLLTPSYDVFAEITGTFTQSSRNRLLANQSIGTTAEPDIQTNIDGAEIGVVAPLEVPMPEAYPEWHTNARPATNPDTQEEITVLPIPLDPNIQELPDTLTQPDIWQGTVADPYPDLDTNPDTGTDTDPDGGTSGDAPSTDIGDYQIDLKNFFPFCIPFDLYDFFTCLNADPVAPVIEWVIPLPGGETYPLEIDLSAFDGVAQLLRRLQLLLFCVGLAFKTRDLIKG